MPTTDVRCFPDSVQLLLWSSNGLGLMLQRWAEHDATPGCPCSLVSKEHAGPIQEEQCRKNQIIYVHPLNLTLGRKQLPTPTLYQSWDLGCLNFTVTKETGAHSVATFYDPEPSPSISDLGADDSGGVRASQSPGRWWLRAMPSPLTLLVPST